ncbi:MAG: hypothetical protein LBB04_01215 [Oscillospiraceae bacterium]|jgi:hypothetical protein|nr:hypothetical protein [Oscillospiraceae bacterium]
MKNFQGYLRCKILKILLHFEELENQGDRRKLEGLGLYIGQCSDFDVVEVALFYKSRSGTCDKYFVGR